jgi:hypothetical protein
VSGPPIIWTRVDELVDSAPGLPALRAHRLQLLAGRRWRELGREVPDDLRTEEQLAAVRDAIAPDILARVRAATDQPVLLLKGPEVARRYPRRSLRPSIDLDLLAPDAERLQEQLIAAGFEPAEDPVWALRLDGSADHFADKHHLRPLRWSGWPLRLEIHRRPSWPAWLPQPASSELLRLAVPGEAEGILVLPPAPHGVLLGAHVWVSNPFARLRDLLDIALLLQEADPDEAEGLARAWRVGLPRHEDDRRGTDLGAAPRTRARADRGRGPPHALDIAVLGAAAAARHTHRCLGAGQRSPPGRRGALAVEAEAQPARPRERRANEVGARGGARPGRPSAATLTLP